MRITIIKYLFAFGALLLLGPVLASLQQAMAPDGSRAASPMLGGSPVIGWASAFGAIALASAIGSITARLVGLRWGVLAAGLALAWPAGMAADLAGALRAQFPASPLVAMAIDGGLLLVVGAGGMWLVQRFAVDRTLWVTGWGKGQVPTPMAVGAGVASGLACGVVVCLFVGLSATRGQSIFAAACGGALAGVCLRMFLIPVHVWSVLLGVGLLAAAGPIVTQATGRGTTELLRMVNADQVPMLVRIGPWQWLAGVLIGLPIGLVWNAQQMAEQAHELDRAGTPAKA